MAVDKTAEKTDVGGGEGPLLFEGFQNDGQILATHKESESMKFATPEEARDFALLHKLSVVANQIS